MLYYQKRKIFRFGRFCLVSQCFVCSTSSSDKLTLLFFGFASILQMIYQWAFGFFTYIARAKFVILRFFKLMTTNNEQRICIATMAQSLFNLNRVSLQMFFCFHSYYLFTWFFFWYFQSHTRQLAEKYT